MTEGNPRFASMETQLDIRHRPPRSARPQHRARFRFLARMHRAAGRLSASGLDVAEALEAAASGRMGAWTRPTPSWRPRRAPA